MDFDRLTPADLVAKGSGKWTRFDGKLGAFVAEMDFGLAPPITQALHEMVDGANFGYLPNALADQLKTSTAAFVGRRYGWQLDPEFVTPLADVLGSLVITMEHLLKPGARVIVPTPAYMPFLSLPGRYHRELIEVPMRRVGDPTTVGGSWEYDLDALDAAFGEGDLLILCNPHNPLGKVATADELTAISELVERHHGLVFNDEIHAPLVYAEASHVPYHGLNEATGQHTITAMAASKAWNLPGLKAAQMIVTGEDLLKVWGPMSFGESHHAATPGVVASIAAYDSGEPWLAEVIDYLDGNRRLLAEQVAAQLPGVGFVPPAGTYLSLLETAGLGLENPYQFFFDRADVALTDGAACGRAGEGAVRINFATPRPIVAQIITQLAQALAAR